MVLSNAAFAILDYKIPRVAKCRGSWVVGRGRGPWVWVWVNVVGKKRIEKK